MPPVFRESSLGAITGKCTWEASHIASKGVACCCRPVYSRTNPPVTQAVVSMSNILMHRKRSQILRFLLRNGPSTCGEIGSELDTSPAVVRRHLALLHSAGLVEPLPAKRFEACPEQVRGQLEALAACFAGEVITAGSFMPMDQDFATVSVNSSTSSSSFASALRPKIQEATALSHFSGSTFHSCECPSTSKGTS